ncbi:bifunctional adenosylcobinamide kinase/adenosylcobinamide-phosphate guanylyltransferase [uncultured Ruminococcus sp.]|jgi:adenosylcobinamide kinase/adenosylcobinamide-phosphate guanylyltransferase|uniref:bifunctional adenosylcobinamide kinase/adenosylcobinamide-phosphate guanylyltransferase n=1 Tax=uncultured Ruminococcus sp. TaxID=165186 RepID=UPI0025D5D86E|nr:bifunctional adenosylcobinamide kinase/adenosylcobinamide-phosphate guanylyltransferase [uncultured Ruminococcus sp.]
MITLVTGGTKCGKSGYAEKVLENFRGPKYYIATMNPVGDDADEIIARHRESRRNKNYITLECPRDVDKLDLPIGCGVLLECIGNLCANEMYVGGNIFRPSDKIISNLKSLGETASEFVIVTNEVGCDGNSYSADLMAYVSEIAHINSRIAEFADNVVECVYGIPVALKGRLV